MSREEWLAAAYNQIGKEIFQQPFVAINLPEARVSVGWPSSRGLGKKSRTIGQCWAGKSAEDGIAQVFISPLLGDPMRVLETLVHEAIHAWDECLSGHKGRFAQAARNVGLEGPLTATHAGEGLADELRRIGLELGEYPHSAIKVGETSGHPKQTTRMLKVECPECGYVIRTTQKWLDVGVPTCPCGTRMEEPW